MYVSGDFLWAYFEGNAGPVPDNAQFIGRTDGDRLLGVVGIWNFDGHNAEVGWAGEPGWLSRGMLRLVFEYVFDQIGAKRLTGHISAGNAKALACIERLGFVREGVLREGDVDGDVYLYGLLARDRKY